ncbi:hypothetical protein AeRB84_016509 [Aphanomyces euteiches]|nr:hypothetical protein AeRB84_016509 [Aphanomyces euteiches]
MVWIGRPFLFLRGLLAMVVLSTAPTQPVYNNGISYLDTSTRPLWKTLLIVGETTWIAYILSDIAIPVDNHKTRHAGPCASILAWIFVLVLDLWFPVSLVATLDRECTTGTTFYQLDCSSGIIQIGSTSRLVVLLLGQLAIVTITSVLAWMSPSPRQGHVKASILLHGSAAAFIHNQQWLLDDVACILSGLLPVKFRGKAYFFDIKLWDLIEKSQLCETSAFCQVSVRSNSPADRYPQCVVPLKTAKHWLIVVVVFLYALMSSMGSYSFIALSTVNLANDYYWATFNLTGAHVALVDWMSSNIMLNRTFTNARMDDSRWTWVGYNLSDPSLKPQVSPGLAGKLQFDLSRKLSLIIQGLRSTKQSALPWIFTQYCWVDFERQWEMASSSTRQNRCMLDAANGAVYLESILRNTDWNKWISSEWGDNGCLNVLTEYSSMISQAINSQELPTVFTASTRSAVQYMTGVLFAVTALLDVYIGTSRGHIEGKNMFALNRVAGIVWVGRPLLLLRSLTALSLLSTGTLELQAKQGVSFFVVPAQPWYKTILGSSEATWLCYILNDVVMAFTHDWTREYASQTFPVVHQVTLDPTCHVDQVDFQLVCHSGQVQIEQASRMYLLLGIIVISNLVWLAIAIFRGRRQKAAHHGSLLLSSGARYLFDRSRWMYNGVYYMDPASALLNGLI